MAEAPVRWDDGEDDDLSRESERETDTESEETLVTANIFAHPVWSIFSHSHASASQRAKLHNVHVRKRRSFVLLSAGVNQELAIAKTEYQRQKEVAAESLECKWNYKQIGKEGDLMNFQYGVVI